MEVMKVESKDGCEIDWLPVVSFNGVEYMVDIENRAFRQCLDSNSRVSFYSDRGREMVKAMTGRQWRAFTPRELWEKEDEQVV